MKEQLLRNWVKINHDHSFSGIVIRGDLIMQVYYFYLCKMKVFFVIKKNKCVISLRALYL